MPDPVLSTVHGTTPLMYTAPYEVDIIVTPILLVGSLRPREIQEQALIRKCRTLDLSGRQSLYTYRLPKRCRYLIRNRTFPRKVCVLVEDQVLNWPEPMQ